MKNTIEIVRDFLNNPEWIKELRVNTTYARLHDDHDGEFTGHIFVSFGSDGDAFISTSDRYSNARADIRFRNHAGGGMSLRVHAALIILAEAIRLDNAERPIHVPPTVQE